VFLAAIAAAAALILSGCSSPAPSTPKATTLTLGSAFDLTTFDTANIVGSAQAVYWKAVYDSLLAQDASGKIIPGAATSWSYNSDNTLLTLKMRQGMKFSDGTPVTAEDAVKNIQYLQTKKGSNGRGLNNVDSVTSSGSSVMLHLIVPDPTLLQFLASGSGVLANPKAFSNPDFAFDPEGSGPYKLDVSKTSKGSQYTYVRNPYYWNKKAYPYDTVVIKPLIDITARLNALRSGQVDAAPLDPRTVAEAKRIGLDIHSYELNWDGLIILDRAGKVVPALGDVRVRQAINMAFDRNQMVKQVLQGYGEVTDQAYIKGNPLRQNGPMKYGYDVKKAKQLMAAAGYADGFDITMPSLPDPDLQQFDAIVQQNLGAIGIRVKYEPLTADSYIPKLISGAYPMFFFRLESQGGWYDIRLALLPQANWNGLHSTDPTLTPLIETARTAPSQEAAHATYQKIGKFVRDQAWFAPLWFNKLILASDKKVDVTPRAGYDVPFIQDYKPAQ
jgi:peptide/nickel transport system substrate-binding protein